MTASTTPQATFGIAITWYSHDIGYIVDASYSGLSADLVDISSHDSASGIKEYLAGMRDGGEVEMTVRFIPGDTTGQKVLYNDAKAGTEREVVITYPDSTTFTFDAVCTKFGDFTLNKDGSADAAITLKATGAPTHSDLE